MNKRIKAISSYIEDNEKVIDVGCDQALLSILLSHRHIYSIASDLRKNIIEKASSNVSEEEKKYITFRVGSGVTLKESEDYKTLVLSGMGAYLMIDILRTTNYRFNKIITISNNHHSLLRRELLSLGYVSVLEEIIKERGKYYNLIIFKEGKKKYTKEELLIGINHQNIPLLKERNNYLINKYKTILNNNKIDLEKQKEINNMIKTLEKFN